MAEQEVIKHTKKIFTVWNNKNLSLWKKVADFLLEIIIIVFAVSLSIWLHGKSEHRHEQKVVKEFLLGIKEDLQNDITEMEEDKKLFRRQNTAFSYFSKIKLGEKLNKDSLNRYQKEAFNILGLIANSGRYEGFKSSGKLGNIKNLKLQNAITDLYQETFPKLLTSTQYTTVLKLKLQDYIIDNIKRTTDSTNNLELILLSDKANFLMQSLSFIKQIDDRYNECLALSKQIIELINIEYHLKN